MRILSLYYGHDSSICLLEDGRPILVVEKERVTRHKHDQGAMDVSGVLDLVGWTPESIDLVAINPHVHPDLTGARFAWELSFETYVARPDYGRPGLRCAPDRRFSLHKLRLLGRVHECVAIDHHLGHIAAGYYASPFDEATILSADGGGDERTCAAAVARGNQILELEYGWGRAGGRVELNIGSTWGSASQYYFGYGRLDGAGKLMGLAPHGRPRERLVEAFAEAATNAPMVALPDGVVPHRVFDTRDPDAWDLAASLQEFTTREYVAAAARFAHRWPGRNVVLTGGCSMNCVANTAVHRSGAFEQSWVTPQAGDCGLAIGQALFAWHHLLGHAKKSTPLSPFLGHDAGAVPQAAIDDAVGHLVEGRTVGVCAGPAEIGPRALGHRSILADPRIGTMRDHLNAAVKFREWYRPFGPMVLAEDYARHFTADVPSSYMSYVTEVRDPGLPAVTHVDESTRPQVVGPEDSLARRLLLEWKRRTGLGVLLNTSLNSQEPMVNTASEAEALLGRTELAALITSGGLAEKRKQPGGVR